MDNIKETIKMCFEKVGMRNIKDETAKRLFNLLDDAFSKRDKKVEEDYISNLLYNEGYSLWFGEARICSADNAKDYNGNKSIVVENGYRKDKAFETIKGAINYIELHYND